MTTTLSLEGRQVARHDGLKGWLLARRYALAGMALVLVSGMAYSFFWRPLHGQSGWATPPDVWTFYAGAHLVGHGDLGGVFAPGTALANFPAFLVLAPAARLTSALGLSDAYPFPLPHPTAWFVLGPVQLLLGTSVLIALDSLAEQLGLNSRRRLVLSLTEAVVVWPLVAIWGHPEVGLAMAFAIAAVTRLLRGNLAACGWLFGVALAFQSLVILMAPVLIAIVPSARQRALFVARSLLPAVVLVLSGLVTYWNATVHFMFQQPNYPTLNHPTPWLSFAPVLDPGYVTHYLVTHERYSHGSYHLVHSWASIRQGEAVAAGPGRFVAIALACVIGLWAWRHRTSVTSIGVLWFMAACLALRCFFESVMDPYYFVPPLLIIVFCASFGRAPRFLTAGLLAVAISVYSEYHFSPWTWYLPLAVLLLASLAVAAPNVAELGMRRISRTTPPVDAALGHGN